MRRARYLPPACEGIQGGIVWKKIIRGMTLLAMLAPAACSFAPDYHRPALPVPHAYKEAGDWSPAKPADEVPRARWWEMFHDPRLNALEGKISDGNQNLKVALAQYEEARAAAGAARAAYFPNVTGGVQPTRERDSPNVANARPTNLYNDYLLGADFSYEVDVWGRVRNLVASAGDRAQASAADLAAIDLSLHAELATDYFALRGDDAAQAILDETVTAYRKASDLTRERFKGGAASEVDYDQAETQYENTKTQASDMRLRRAQLEHAIAVLTGAVPATFAIEPLPIAGAPPAIAPGLPSTLLERRPDVAAAERRAAAANADIGVARAAWFPTFSITGMLGFESANASNWLTLPSHYWTIGPSLVGPLFDGGRINTLSDEARAAYGEAAASYRATVLNAYREVEDNLIALHSLDEESKSQLAATTAADRALAREQDRYKGGLVTYLEVVVLENTALQARLANADILTRRMTASVQLVKALGGGWQETPPAAVKK